MKKNSRKQHFDALTRPLADQFSANQPLPGLSINGKLTLTENIADLGGLAAAFDAYRKTLGSRLSDAEYVSVRNLDAWYEAFDVRPGQRLYLEPAARVRIW